MFQIKQHGLIASRGLELTVRNPCSHQNTNTDQSRSAVHLHCHTAR